MQKKKVNNERKPYFTEVLKVPMNPRDSSKPSTGNQAGFLREHPTLIY